MSHASPRSLRVKVEAQQRPDVIWTNQRGRKAVKIDKPLGPQPTILSGGSDLAILVQEADAHLVAMRKIAG